MNYDQIMLDLETFGVCDNAAIISIGAVRFSLDTSAESSVDHFSTLHPADGSFPVIDDFDAVVSVKEMPPQELGTLDASTVMWWMHQSEEARKALQRPDSIPLRAVLEKFSAWVKRSPTVGLWSNGPSFDERLLRQAYDRCGMTWPFKYNAGRDVRTMREVASQIGFEQKPLGARTAHKALDDALDQAMFVVDVFRSLKK